MFGYIGLSVVGELDSDFIKLLLLVDYVLVLDSYHLVVSCLNWLRWLRLQQASSEAGGAVCP